MTEAEKELMLQKARTCIAFGGGKVMPEMEQDFRDKADGKITHEQAIERIKARYGAT